MNGFYRLLSVSGTDQTLGFRCDVCHLDKVLDWDGGDVEVAHCDDQTTTYTDDFRRRMGLPIVKLREAGISQRQQEKKHRSELSAGQKADRERHFAKQRQQKRGSNR